MYSEHDPNWDLVEQTQMNDSTCTKDCNPEYDEHSEECIKAIPIDYTAVENSIKRAKELGIL